MDEDVPLGNVELYVMRQGVGIGHTNHPHLVLGNFRHGSLRVDLYHSLAFRYFLPCLCGILRQRMDINFHYDATQKLLIYALARNQSGNLLENTAFAGLLIAKSINVVFVFRN